MSDSERLTALEKEMATLKEKLENQPAPVAPVKKTRQPNAYMKFGKHMRPKILKENPGINPIGEMAK